MNVRSIAMSLWDVLRIPDPVVKPLPKHRPMQDKYDALVLNMKETYGFRILKWRSSMSGCAWELKDKQGNISRLIESPYPKGPMSCVVFLHEVGHHAIGFHVYRPRCLEEYYAWEWAFKAMKENNIRLTNNVQKRREQAIQYAVSKALRRGLRSIPQELVPFLPDRNKMAS